MKLVDFAITPHYCSKFAAAVGEAASKTDYATIALTDQQAVLVNSAKIDIIGPGEKIIFNNQAMKAAQERGRELSLEELKEVFQKAKD